MFGVIALALNLALAVPAWRGAWVEVSLAALLIAVLARHDGVVAAIGRAVARLGAYRTHQLVNHLGQLHRAMATAATAWLVAAVRHTGADPRSLALTGVVVLMVVMGVTACDAVRSIRHDRFERIHRYGGWSALAIVSTLVGARVVEAIGAGRPASALPVTLLTMATVAAVVHPWAAVRRLPVEVVDVTSDLVVVFMPGARRVGDFVRVSLDGREWHAFAVSTCGREPVDHCSLVIRRAGDWTERLAQSCASPTPPRSLLVRTRRGFGFMGFAQAYRHVLVVATGAGIGPVLPYLLDRHQPGLRCVWIGRDHRTSVGDELVDRVMAGGQTVLVDTGAGRPAIDRLVHQHLGGAEAVFVVSNAAVRDEVAAVCCGLGVRWYGPTFDS